MKSAFGALAVLLIAAGCGGGQGGAEQSPGTTVPPPTATTSATTTAVSPTKLELFFIAQDGRLVADSRTVEHTATPGAAALDELRDAPSDTTTQVPDGVGLIIDNGAAHLSGPTLNQAAFAQVVYTLTSFPTVQSVDGKTRADVEFFVPSILVEHPVAGESVSSPFHVTGTANTFEATFNYRLEDDDGKVLAKDFVTATSGSGTRGTFDFEVPFAVDEEQDGKLAVFELSAKDGSVIHERVIPLRLVP